MKKYETIFIVDDGVQEDAGKSFIEKLNPIIDELGGQIIESQDLGHRQFAHPIKKRASGYYWDVVIDLPRNQVAALKDKFHLDSSVLRLEVFNYESIEEPNKSVSENVKEEAETSV